MIVHVKHLQFPIRIRRKSSSKEFIDELIDSKEIKLQRRVRNISEYTKLKGDSKFKGLSVHKETFLA